MNIETFEIIGYKEIISSHLLRTHKIDKFLEVVFRTFENNFI